MAKRLIILSICTLTVILGDALGLFEFLEGKTYDLRARLLAGTSRPSEDILVILVDQNSIDWAYRTRGWSYPWPRKAYAEITNYLRLGGAASIAFDILFSEPSVYGPEDDAAFAEAAAAFGRAVQSVHFSTQWGSNASWPADLDKPLLGLRNFGDRADKYALQPEEADASQFRMNPAEADRGRIGAQFPVAELRNTAAVIGTVTNRSDQDGIFRRTKLFTLFDGKAAPGLSAASLLAAGGSREIAFSEKNRALEWNGYTIPVDNNGASLLRFRKSIDAYIPYSAYEVLQSAESSAQGEEPILYPEDFAGKYVFVGYYAPGLFDLCNTPVSPVYPGVGVHITMLDNMLQEDFIRTVPASLRRVLIIAAAALAGFFTFSCHKIPLAVGGCAAALVILWGGAFAAYHGGFWLPVVAPMMGILAAFLTATLYNYATEGSQRRFIKMAFSQYLSPTVIDQLLANPKLLSLGGERREISIFFSDVQGFTSISEKLDPAKLTVFLNDYLSFMTDTILESGGTIDKYEGDAIIAFWNAPLNYADHAARALRASMACQQKLAARQDSFEEKFGFRLLTRIGLNTGYAVVGNMGSSKRFDYTMLGDSVNLAARLEGLNKQFGTYLMCTENTFSQALRAGQFWGRKLAQVAVVGKKEPVTVYEPMPEEVFQEKAGVLRQFDAARDMFYQGDFAAALALFDALSAADKPSFYYAEQCRYYLENPGQWKGFWQALTK